MLTCDSQAAITVKPTPSEKRQTAVGATWFTSRSQITLITFDVIAGVIMGSLMEKCLPLDQG